MKIKDARGVLVQQQVEGTEVILGAKKEGMFGHLIMFGLGGIYTEALKDVSFALAPLGAEEGMNMIGKIKTLPILKGIRGEKGVSIEVLAEYLARISLLVHHFPRIEEIDLNPVKGFEKDLYVVDGRIIQRSDDR
jgi:acetyltransferase